MPRVKKNAVTHTAADDLLDNVMSGEEKFLALLTDNRDKALAWALMAGGIAVLVAGAFLLCRRGEAKASDLLAQALDNYHAKVGEADPADPGAPHFPTDEARLAAAMASADTLLADHPASAAARQARLLKMGMLAESGKTKDAYEIAAGLSASGDPELAALGLAGQADLAKALALKTTRREGDKDVEVSVEQVALERAVELRSPFFPAASARLRLADIKLAAGKTEEARALLKAAQDDRDGGEAARKAGEKLRGLPPAPAPAPAKA